MRPPLATDVHVLLVIQDASVRQGRICARMSTVEFTENVLICTMKIELTVCALKDIQVRDSKVKEKLKCPDIFVVKVKLLGMHLLNMFLKMLFFNLSADGNICKAADPCAKNTCVHGRCVASSASYSCACEPGYAGVMCNVNVDDCKSNPCKNGATCVDGVNRYTCLCSAGYTGELLSR